MVAYMGVLVKKLNLKVYGVLQEWKEIWVCNVELVTDVKIDDLTLSSVALKIPLDRYELTN